MLSNDNQIERIKKDIKDCEAINKNKWYRYGDPVDLLHKLRGSADA